MEGQGEDTIREIDKINRRESQAAGITKGAPLNKSTKESITKSIEATIEEMITIAKLKEAIANYLRLDDSYECERHIVSGFCSVLGNLELSLILRKQSLDEDRKALLELKDE